MHTKEESIALKSSTARCLSSAVVNVPRKCWKRTSNIADILNYSHNGTFETVMEIVLIEVFFLTIDSKLKNKNGIPYDIKYGIPWHPHAIQKSALLKTREFHFFLS